MSDTEKRVPDLLEELCSHSECPEWLRDGIWDLVNDAANDGGRPIRFDAEHWRHEFEAIEDSPVLDRADLYLSAQCTVHSAQCGEGQFQI